MRPTISSDASASALLGALAGLMASKGSVFEATNAVDATRALLFLLSYALLFVLPAYWCWSFKLSREDKIKEAGDALIVTTVVYIVLFFLFSSTLFTFGVTSGNTFTLSASETFAVPIVLLPIIWASIVAVDALYGRSTQDGG